VTSEAESHAAADADEALTDTFEEPIRRADAMWRLEAWLTLHPPPRLSDD
jgi:hypothetical protein